MAKYTPKTREELQKLVQDESIYLGDIDTSAITNMYSLFANSERRDFSGIELWDTSNVVDMSRMFDDAKYFNHNINSWDTSSVINMSCMFQATESFNQPLDKWDTSNVVDMSYMFCGDWSPRVLAKKNTIFNQDISSWNTSSVVNMESMFQRAKYFNQNISSWDISNVKYMGDMFKDAENFNQNLNAWDTSSVRDNLEMFWGSGIKSLPKWWKKKEVENVEKHKWIDEVMEKTTQAEANPRSKEERQKEKEQKQAQKQAQKKALAEQKAKQTKGFAKIALIAFAVLFVISFVFNLISGDDETSTPKQSSAQAQQSPQPQETQRLESTNLAQISPEPSENIKSDTANTPSDESVNLNENSSENVAQNSAQADTPSESVNLMPSQNTKPSFDCAKVSTNAEKLVCSDDELARLDNELANAYKNARNSLDNASKKQLTNEQKSWLKTYNQCADKECVKYHLQTRIQALQSSGAKAGIRLNTNDEYVNLRRSPSGEILTAIYKSDFDKITLKKLETNDKWIKVLYFAPNVTNQDDAIMGYIHISQIDESSL